MTPLATLALLLLAPSPDDPGSTEPSPVHEDATEAAAEPAAAEPTQPETTPQDAREPVESVAEPPLDALGHLERAMTLEAEGDLESAEAEASVAIAMDPDDPAAYLTRARIRMKLADRPTDEADVTVRRARAALLRLAADDVDAYLERSALPADDRVFIETRRDALLRDADALDPPPPPEPVPEPEELTPLEPTPPESRRSRRRGSNDDFDPRRRTGALVGSGAALAAVGVGLSAASLQIRQSCDDQGLCAARWRVRPPMLAPAIALSALGTSSIVLGIASAPSMSRPRTRRIVGTTAVTLGSAATVTGIVTGALTLARWGTIVPSDVSSLRTTQTLGNAATTSLSAALPLLTAGLTAWLSGRRRADHRTAWRRGLVR